MTSTLKKLLIPLGLLSVFVVVQLPRARAATINATPPNSLMNGLVGWWTFDGPNMANFAKDSSGQGNNAVLINFTSTSSALVQGKIGQALKFNGTNNIVATNAAASVNDLVGMTISTWVKTPSISSGTLLSKGDNSSGGHGWMFDLTGTGRVRFSVAGFGGTDLSVPSADNFMTANQWVHVVVTWDGTNLGSGVRLYRNGVEYGGRGSVSNGGSGPQSDAAFGIQIGSNTGGGGNGYYAGMQDDVRLYNRVLTAAEIQKLYASTAGSKQASSPQVSKTTSCSTGLSCGLVGNWTFDGPNMLTNVKDSSGQGNNGFMSGFTSTSTAVGPGKVGQGLKFDGVDDYVDAGNSAWISQSFSVGAWVKTNYTGASQVILSKLSGASAWQFYLRLNSTGQVAFKLYGVDSTTDQREWGTTQTGFNDGKWHYVAVTAQDIDGNIVKTITIYVDGTARANTLINSFGSNNAYSLKASTIKAGVYFAPSLALPFSGSIDDIRMYDRALSANDIIQLYNLASATKQSAAPQVTNTLCTAGLSCGLIGYWTFDGPNLLGNVKDSSGQGNNGLLGNFTSTSSAVVTGKMGQALRFDGVGNYIYVAPSSSLNNLGAMTISLWIKPKSFAACGAYNCGVVEKQSSSHGWLLSANSSGSLGFTVYGTGGNGIRVASVAGSVVGTNSWTHVVVTWDGSQSYVNTPIYFNAVKQSAGGGSGDGTGSSIDDSSRPVHIGYDQYDGALFNGTIDDVRIYNRALTVAEIRQLYNLGK